MRNPVIAVIFILAFVGGIRGTSALHRLNKTDVDQSNAVAT